MLSMLYGCKNYIMHDRHFRVMNWFDCTNLLIEYMPNFVVGNSVKLSRFGVKS